MIWIGLVGIAMTVMGIIVSVLHAASATDDSVGRVRLVSAVCGVVSAVGFAIVLAAFTFSVNVSGVVSLLVAVFVGCVLFSMHKHRYSDEVRVVSLRSFLFGFAVTSAVTGALFVGLAFAVGEGLKRSLGG